MIESATQVGDVGLCYRNTVTGLVDKGYVTVTVVGNVHNTFLDGNRGTILLLINTYFVSAVRSPCNISNRFVYIGSSSVRLRHRGDTVTGNYVADGHSIGINRHISAITVGELIESATQIGDVGLGYGNTVTGLVDKGYVTVTIVGNAGYRFINGYNISVLIFINANIVAKRNS